MTHETFVFAAYTVTAIAVIALVVWVVLDGKARRRELAQLEASGIKRRSDQD